MLTALTCGVGCCWVVTAHPVTGPTIGTADNLEWDGRTLDQDRRAVRILMRPARWGSARTGRLADLINDAAVVWPDIDLAEAYAEFRVACVRRGHALSQQIHEADRWIASSALLLGVPLVTHDRVFRGAPGLALRTTGS